MNETSQTPEQPGGGKKSNSLLQLVVIFAVLALIAVVAAFVIGGGSDDDDASQASDAAETAEFDVEIEPSTGAGPNPLKVSFKTAPVNADGDVAYRWQFDEDGATATGSDPSITYNKTGWKLVKVTAQDEAGKKANAAAMIRVWPKDVWTGLLSKKISPAEQQKILVANLRAYERKTGGKIAGISAAPLPGQEPLTPESRKAQREEPAKVRRANRRALREFKRKQREERRKKREQERQSQSQ